LHVEICVANLKIQYNVSVQNVYLSTHMQYHIHVYSSDDEMFNELNAKCQSCIYWINIHLPDYS